MGYLSHHETDSANHKGAAQHILNYAPAVPTKTCPCVCCLPLPCCHRRLVNRQHPSWDWYHVEPADLCLRTATGQPAVDFVVR